MMPLDFTTVPAGIYTVRIREVRTSLTRSGDPRWALALEVADGIYTGRLAAWDAMVWSTRGKARVRRILRALGISQDPETVTPDSLTGRLARVEVRPVEFSSPDGDTIRRNEVPYDGWDTATEGGAS